MTLPEITSTQWSISLSGPGDIVTDLEDIKQCMYIILATRKGSRQLQPAFGCNIFDSMDMPLSVAGPRMVKDTRAALVKWEPRAIIEDVTFEFEQEQGVVVIKIYWRPIAGTRYGQLLTTEFGVKDGIIWLVNEYNELFETEYGDIEI